MMKIKGRRALGLAGILWLLLVIYQACQDSGTEKEKTAPVDQGVTALGSQQYAGSSSCQPCHQEAYQAWTGSHHDLAMQEANDSTVLGDFNNQIFSFKGIDSRYYRDGDRFMVDTEGPRGTIETYPVAYVFGVYPLQQYLVEFPGGRLQALHTAWDSKEKKWFHLYPDEKFHPSDWLHWTNGGQNWNAMCADCHSTELRKNYNVSKKTYNTTYQWIDVSCEACHGPGQAHIDAVNASNYQKGNYQASEHLVQTRGSTNLEQVEQCAPCHSRRTALTTDYMPGDAFHDHYVPQLLIDNLYHADGQILDEVYVYGSFVQSKMYHQGVKCTDCHDPHRAALKLTGNDLCMQCHESSYNSKSHHFHPVESEGASCINCHMTGRYYMVNDFRRDHSFRVPRPDQTVAFGTPNSCNGCHTDQSPEWAAKAVENWYGPDREVHFSDYLIAGRNRTQESVPGLVALVNTDSFPAISRATALYYLSDIPNQQGFEAIASALRDQEPLVRHAAVQALANMPLQERQSFLLPLVSDSVRMVRIAAINALPEITSDQVPVALLADFQRARNEMATYFNTNADFSSGQLNMGTYMQRQGKLARAEVAYKEALRIDSLYNMARVNLASLYSGQGRIQEAIDLYQWILATESSYPEGYYSLGLLFAESNQYDSAAYYLEQAARLMPENDRVFYNWGLSLQHTGNYAEAERVFRRGLVFAPQSGPLHYALAILYAQRNQPDMALSFAEKLIAIEPNNQQYRELYSNLRNQFTAP